MNRLRDDEDGELSKNPLLQRGVEMLRKTPPTQPAPDAKQRVWLSIRRARASALASGGRRPLILRLAVAVAVVLVAGTAGAVITRRWIAPRLHGDARGAAPPPATQLAPRAVRSPRPQAASPVAPADLAAPVAETRAGDSRASKGLVRAAPRRVAAAAPAAAAVARERTEVLDALIALRREHDAARAGAMLSGYLAAHPRGTLREEALALAIEAADARGDRAAGEQLARTYQAEFPAGRFLPFARSHTK
jgi:hypothetical protein